MMEIIETFMQYFSSKDWTLYPFISPICSIIVSLYLSPIFSDIYAANLQAWLENEGIGDKYVIIQAIAKDRSLQAVYLSSTASFFTSLIAAAKSDHPILLYSVLGLVIIPILASLLKIFMRYPGYLSSTRFPAKAKLNYLYRKAWTYNDLYSKLLILLNVIIIIVIIIALPNKS